MEIKKIMKQVFEIMEKSPATKGIPSGYKELDLMINGFHAGDLITIAGEQQICHSFIQNVIINQTSQEKSFVSVLIISPCISDVNYAMQLLPIKSKVPLKSIYHANSTFSQTDWDAITMAFEPIADSPYYIVDKENISISQIQSKAETIDKDLIQLDVMQLNRCLHLIN
jgi:replicative DNA helicase